MAVESESSIRTNAIVLASLTALLGPLGGAVGAAGASSIGERRAKAGRLLASRLSCPTVDPGPILAAVSTRGLEAVLNDYLALASEVDRGRQQL
jgi:hypothetical protein